MATPEETTTLVRIPRSTVPTVVGVALMAVLPTGAFAGAGYASRTLSDKIDAVAEGQRRLEEKFARLEGSGLEGRIKGLEDRVQAQGEKIADMHARLKEDRK
jgi:hypothetical protein